MVLKDKDKKIQVLKEVILGNEYSINSKTMNDLLRYDLLSELLKKEASKKKDLLINKYLNKWACD